MQKLIFCLIFIAIIVPGNGQKVNSAYDSTLAKRLGADDYGMKSYVLVILKTGPTQIEASPKRDSLFAGHMNNIQRLADLGKLVVAGPLKKNDKLYRGIFILDVKTIEEAKELVNTDPVVKSGVMDVEFYQWYGSAALPEYLEIHKKIEKKQP